MFTKNAKRPTYRV